MNVVDKDLNDLENVMDIHGIIDFDYVTCNR
jgi:hypothetical protein